MALKKRNSDGTSVTINSDGITIGGGTTTETDLTITGGDMTLTGGSSATLTSPNKSGTYFSDTLIGRKEFMSRGIALQQGLILL